MHTKRKTTRIICYFLLCALLSAAALFAVSRYVYHKQLARAEALYLAQYVTAALETDGIDYTESTDILSGSGGSFYYLWGWLLSETADDTALQKKLAREMREYRDESMILIEINLMNYADGDLSAKALAQTQTILDAWSDAGYQIILRFLYDWDGNALQTEPKELSTVLTHMTQLAPLINAHADSIYTMQGIFVGNCAEMHTSRFMDDDSMCTLIRHLADVTDPDIYLAVRTPAQRRTILGSDEILPNADALAARLGLFNDGILGSDNDLGTYGEADRAQAQSLTQRWVRAQELDYQDALCRLVPNGGEAVIDNPLNDLPEALTDLSRMHISYLNRMHHAEVIDKWRATTLHTGDVWDGTNGYTYLDAHLGSRYRCSGVSAEPFDFQTNQTFDLQLTLTNTGFSGSYEPLTLHAAITDTSGRCLSTYSWSDTTLATRTNGEEETVTLSIDPRDYAEGTYYLALSLTRADGTRVPFASRTLYGAHGYRAASFSINKTPTSIPASGELLRRFRAQTSSAK